MRILCCCELYAPSMGGVQKVIQEISEHLVGRGHEVCIATTKLPGRTFTSLNGVHIKEFSIKGNYASGLEGDVEEYQRFVIQGGFDALLIKAAQQWTFDALFPVLHLIKARKVHVPCGYSNFYHPKYSEYYRIMPSILKQFDHLIYYTSDYRDINYAKDLGLKNISVIPNGASEKEFETPPDVDIRKKLKVKSSDFLFLTVGSPPVEKGHIDVLLAYNRIRLPFPSVLILNGDYSSINKQPSSMLTLSSIYHYYYKIMIRMSARRIAKKPHKKAFFTNFSRKDLIAAFFTSNLFVFASHIEYSPLVLFEAVAAGLPFLSVSVGNADEIAQWTGGGRVLPARRDKQGRVIVNVHELSHSIQSLACSRDELALLGEKGRSSWMEKYTWKDISLRYESLLMGKLTP